MAINSVGPATYGPYPQPYNPGVPPSGYGYGVPPSGYAGDVYRPGSPYYPTNPAYGYPPQAPTPITGSLFGGITGLFQGLIRGIINGITGFFQSIIGAVTGLIRGFIEIFTGKGNYGTSAVAPYPGVPFNPAAPPMGGFPIPPGPTNASDPRVVKAISPAIAQISSPQMAQQIINMHLQRAQQQHDSMVAEAKDIERMAQDMKAAAQRRDQQRLIYLQQQITYRLEDLRQRSIAVYDELLYGTVVSNALLSPAGRFGMARINMNKPLETAWRNWSGGPRWWIFGHIDGAQEIYTKTNQIVNAAMAQAAPLGVSSMPGPTPMMNTPTVGGYR